MKYLETTTLSQSITAFTTASGTTTVSPAQTLTQWLSNHPAWGQYTYNNDPANYFTSVLTPDAILTVSLSADGTLPAEIFAGATPPRRPK